MPVQDDAQGDWATFITRRLDGVVDLIRDKAVRPAARATRSVVVGALATVVGIAVGIIVLVGLLHLLDTTAFRGHAFITDFALGGIMLIAGAFFLRASARAGRMDP